jgi:segregation and condensation protein B
MTAAARRRQRSGDESLDVELADLPAAARWREWMLRVEAAIFASPKPVPREALVRLVGEACRFDDLIADLIHELRGRPTISPSSPAVMRCTPNPLRPGDPRPSRPRRRRRCGIDPDGNLCAHCDRLSAAGHTGGDLEAGGTGDQSRRDRLSQAPRPDRRRHPRPSTRRPFAYVTTRKFLEAFGFASLRDLPDLERLKAGGLLERGQGEDELDSALGLMDDQNQDFSQAESPEPLTPL